MMMSDAIVILSTTHDPETARTIAHALLEERLIACCTVVPGAQSIYRWEGRVEEASETMMLIKTTAELFDAVAARIVELHPYDVPEIISLPISNGSPDYLTWLRGEVRSL